MIALSILLLLLVSPATPAAGRVFPTAFSDYAESMVEDASLRGSSWSILFYSLANDSVIYEYDADRLLTPASITKLFTSAAALDALGPDYQFTTVCFRDGPLSEDGILHGNLVVQAGGDPTPEVKWSKYHRAPALRAWADSLRDSGLRAVTGNLVLRVWPYRLESAASGWEIGDINAGFAPPTDGFGFNNNVCHLGVFPGGVVGAPARYVLDPVYAPVSVRSDVVTVDTVSMPWIEMWSVPHDTTIVLTGEIPLHDDGEYLWIPMQDPARYFGHALRHALIMRGITVYGNIIVERSLSGVPIGEPLTELHSAPLPSVLSLMNKDSDNYISEYVLAALGLAVTGSAERRHGLKALERFVGRCGISSKSLHLEDGCGLSRRNAVNARSVVGLLRAMHHHPVAEVFRSTLSVSGIDGTLSYRLSTKNTARRVRAKTGSMTYVSGLAGYAETASGDTVAFAVLCNNFSCSLSRVRWAEDSIIERFLETYP